jgi:uncharacterized protein YbjT (DUF2867 family)
MRIAIAGATGTVGQHVARIATERGHEVVPLSRSAGQDAVTGAGLDAALTGSDAVIDVLDAPEPRKKAAVAFFTATTRNLLAAERRAGIGHHVTLSIVGIDGLHVGYYAGKLAQERLVAEGRTPYSVLRATQFHEFAERYLHGPKSRFAVVPVTELRPVAASEVGAALVTAAEGPAAGRLRDLTGPRDEELDDMVHRLGVADGTPVHVVRVAPPGRLGRAQRSGVLRGGDGADRGTIGFAEWLASRGA